MIVEKLISKESLRKENNQGSGQILRLLFIYKETEVFRDTGSGAKFIVAV